MGRMLCGALFLLGCGAATTRGGDASTDSTPEASADVARPAHTEIAATFNRTCVVRTDGSTWCIGAIPPGMLGTDERIVNEMVRMAVPPALSVAMVESTTCLLLADRTVRCFDPLGEPVDRRVPLPEVAEFGAFGVGTLCARTTAGEVWCWGENHAQLLGADQPEFVTEPRRLYAGASAFSMGAYHACAARFDGSVQCWGENFSGAVGLPEDVRRSDVPITIEGVDNAARVAVGGWRSCALTRDGRGRCWGWLTGSQPYSNSSSATPFPAIDGASELLSNEGLSYSIAPDHTLRFWLVGGLLSVGNPLALREVQGIPSAVAGSVTPGTWFAVDDHEIRGTGRCACGNCGVAQLHERLDPHVVRGLSDAVDLQAGYNWTCALRANGAVACWGYRWGDYPATRAENAPSAIEGLDDATSIAVAGPHACAVRASGGLVCWGFGIDGVLGPNQLSGLYAIPGITDAVEVAVSTRNACARHVGGEVSCWGTGNAFGLELSDVMTCPRAPCGVPARVPGLVGVAQMSMDSSLQCARMTDGAVRCWGSNSYGLLGNGTLSEGQGTAEVSAVRGATQVEVGAGFACARTADGAVRCWGGIDGPELGRPNTPRCDRYRCATSPVQAVFEHVVDLSAGLHACTVHEDGGVTCWGGGALWRVNPGSRSADNHPGSPARIAGVSRARRVTVAMDHDCALLADGSVVCWGLNDEAQRGDGTRSERDPPPYVLRW